MPELKKILFQKKPFFRLPLLFRQACTWYFNFQMQYMVTNEMYNSQNHMNTPRPHPKMISFWKNKCSPLLFMLIDITYCLLPSNRKKCAVYCGLPKQSFVNWLLYCYSFKITVLLSFIHISDIVIYCTLLAFWTSFYLNLIDQNRKCL